MIARITAVAAALALTLGLAAAPASAQTTQEGLVNLAVTDTNIQVPVSVAANVCGVAVNVLARSLNAGGIECTAEGVSHADREGGNGGPTKQRGLVNVSITGTNVQVPIGIAANVCGVSANVLSDSTNLGEVICEAEGVAIAEN
jgi:hypothetical protein